MKKLCFIFSFILLYSTCTGCDQNNATTYNGLLDTTLKSYQHKIDNIENDAPPHILYEREQRVWAIQKLKATRDKGLTEPFPTISIMVPFALPDTTTNPPQAYKISLAWVDEFQTRGIELKFIDESGRSTEYRQMLTPEAMEVLEKDYEAGSLSRFGVMYLLTDEFEEHLLDTDWPRFHIDHSATDKTIEIALVLEDGTVTESIKVYQDSVFSN